MYQKIKGKMNRNDIKQEATYLFHQKYLRQAVVNFGAKILAMCIGIVTSSIVVRALGSHYYGKYNLLLTLVGTIAIFSSWGFTESYSRRLLVSKEKKEQDEIVGIGLLIFLAQAGVLFLITLAALPLVQWIYKDFYLTKSLFAANIFTSLSVFVPFFLFTTRERNHMYWQALFSIAQPIIFVLLILFMVTYSHIGAVRLIALSSIAMILPIALYLYRNKPSLRHAKKHWDAIKQERKSFGIHVFISQLFERITFNLDSLMLGAVLYSSVGYYALGSKLTRPIETLSWSGTDAVTKTFAEKDAIPAKILFYNFLWWIGSSIGVYIIARPFITLVWGEEFLIIMSFLWILLLNALFSNFYHIYYNFLYAKGIGKEVKKYFYIRGAVNLGGNIMLIPFFGIIGACFATLASNVVFCVNLYYEYKKLIRNV